MADLPIGAFECFFQLFLRLSLGKQFAYDLETEHQPVKALQESIVQIPGDTHAFVDALLHANVELIGDLLDMETVCEP